MYKHPRPGRYDGAVNPFMADQTIIRKTFQATETRAAGDGDSRRLIVTILTNAPNRSRDVVEPGGIVTDHYVRNPVVAALHRYNQPAIGVVVEVEFLHKGIYPLADCFYNTAIER